MPLNALRAFALALAAISLCFDCTATAATQTMPSRSSAQHPTALQQQLDELVRRAQPGTLGIVVIDLQDGQAWRANADRAFPMMSVFKAPVVAAVLAGIEQGRWSYGQTVVVHRDELESGTIRDHFQGERMSFTVRQLLTDAVSHSDNTAVDTLLKVIGDPQVVTTFLRAHGIDGMRVDIGERGFGSVFEDLQPGQSPPAHETDAQQLARLRRGYRAYLADPRNRSTPGAAADFLRKLWNKELLSPASTQYLLDLMYAQTTPSRLRLGLPPGVRLADKCGTSYTLEHTTAAYNDIGILTWPDGHAVAIAAFLTASTAPKNARDAIFADLTRAVVAALHPRDAAVATTTNTSARRGRATPAAQPGSNR
jgi:Beta-lactamase class A